MPIKVPPGYVTRPVAPQFYNRSQRALERDLDIALATQEETVLSQWKLFTKDDKERDAREVTTELVKQLQSDGMVPTWCVKHTYLEQKYGRKGSSKPSISKSATRQHESDQQNDRPSEATNRPVNGADSTPLAPMPDDVAFLKERVRILEKERAEEQERQDQLIAKLFSQLDVKDKQISAWDEVTQGLTKALATGQLQPKLLAEEAGRRPDVSERVHDVKVVEENDVAKKEGSTVSQKPAKRKPQSIAKRKRAPKNRNAKQPDAKKANWYDTPTLNKVASRFFSRS